MSGRSSRCFITLWIVLPVLPTVSLCAPRAAAAAEEPAAIKRITDQLDKKTNLSFVDTQLNDSLEFIQQLHDLPIVIDAKELADQGIDAEAPINHQISGISLRNGLALILEPLDLDWIIAHEVLMITSREKAARHTEVRIYDVADLKKAGFVNVGLQQAISTTIAAESWTSHGGKGSIHRVPGGLVVRQTRKIHKQIEHLLADIRHVAFDHPVRPHSANEARIRAAFNEKTALNFVDNPLQEDVSFIAALHDIPIVIDVKKLLDSGVDVETPLSWQLEGISLSSALNLILEPLELDYTIQHEVLLITSRAKAARIVQTRVYRTTQLVGDEFTPNDLALLIQDMVMPESWSVTGGKGSIAALPGCLIVTQSERAQEKIVALFGQLEIRAKPKANEKE